MTKWDKVTLTWDCCLGIGTSVRIDNGVFDPNVFDPTIYGRGNNEVHGLFKMEATSLPSEGKSDQRCGQFKLDIKRLSGTNVPPKSKEIVKLLDERFKVMIQHAPGNICHCKYKPDIMPPEKESWTDTVFTVQFWLGNGEQFCDTAIEIARAIFEGLGIKDERGTHLANFSIKRETYVKIDDSWITFPRWLRINHRLPIWGAEDMLST